MFHEKVGDVARPNAVSTPRVICGLVNKIHETELRRTKQTLKLGRVDDVAFEVIENQSCPI
jgi:hypothetical protein